MNETESVEDFSDDDSSISSCSSCSTCSTCSSISSCSSILCCSSVSSSCSSCNLENDHSENELLDLEADVYENINDYIDEFAIQYSNPKFHESLIDDVSQLIIMGGVETGLFDNEDDDEPLHKFVEKRAECFFEMGIAPLRSYPADYIVPPQSQETKDILKIQLTYLLNLPQQTQRTPEWYSTRHGLMTASNIYKIFGSQCLYNSFICDKCKPLLVPIENEEKCVNTESPMHWGVKYEPLTQMIYKILYCSKEPIAEFGCIQHPDFNCIGASPDGINIDSTSNHYGHMIEIKNIVNREITSIPSEAYWVQTQIQMEVCGLDMCDFVETRFKEYNDEEEFWMEEGNDEGGNEKEFRGIILYFVHKTAVGSTPFYEYRIVDSDSYYKSKHKRYTDDWINETIAENQDYSLYKTIYWYLDEISCIIIPRNKIWFNSAIEKILDTWKVIEKERVDGFSHRLPKKINKVKPNICVIKLE